MTDIVAQDVRRRRWLVLASSFYVQFNCGGLSSTNGLFMVEFIKTFDESAATLSWIFTILFFMVAILTPVSGYLTSMYGAQKVVASGAIIVVVGLVMTAFTDSLPLLFLTFSVLIGTGIAVIYIPALSIVAEYFTDRYAFANGIAGVGAGVGFMIFSPLVETLIQVYGWHGTFLILAGLFANIFVCAMIMKPVAKTTKKHNKEPFQMESNTSSQEGSASDTTVSGLRDSSRVNSPDGYTPVQDDEQTPESAVDGEHGGRCSTSNKKTGRNIFSVIYHMWGFYIFPRYPCMAVLIVCMMGFGIAMVMYMMWIVVRAVDIGISRMNAAALMTALGMSSVTGRLSHGWFVDLKVIPPMALLASMFALNALSVLTYTLVTNYVIMVIACVGIGLSHGVGIPMFNVCTKEIVQLRDLPNAIGLIFFVQGTFGGMALIFAGELYDNMGDSRMPLFVAVIFCAIALVTSTAAVCVNCYGSRNKVKAPEREGPENVSTDH
ncbi:monocarboxylate transporter 12-like [Ptychodera flava]|uniref:monocarboxylate transporter 12-like n=1 Tax=Ptychodera flava TaxID=63121 RepID=UPI00396A8555